MDRIAKKAYIRWKFTDKKKKKETSVNVFTFSYFGENIIFVRVQ